MSLGFFFLHGHSPFNLLTALEVMSFLCAGKKRLPFCSTQKDYAEIIDSQKSNRSPQFPEGGNKATRKGNIGIFWRKQILRFWYYNVALQYQNLPPGISNPKTAPHIVKIERLNSFERITYVVTTVAWAFFFPSHLPTESGVIKNRSNHESVAKHTYIFPN